MNHQTAKIDSKGRSCFQIFQELAKRQLTALMFHTKTADFFDFLNLHGFKRLHEHQYYEESREHRKTKSYYINQHNALLNELKPLDEPDTIPSEWFKYTRFDVTPQARRQSIEQSFKAYYDWESETKACYEDYATSLAEMGQVADAEYLTELVDDVSCELQKLTRMMLVLKSVNYDEIFVAEIQKKIHDKYKKKIK